MLKMGLKFIVWPKKLSQGSLKLIFVESKFDKLLKLHLTKLLILHILQQIWPPNTIPRVANLKKKYKFLSFSRIS